MRKIWLYKIILCVRMGCTKVMYEQMLIFAPHIEFAFGTRASWDDPSTPVPWADQSGVASSCKPYRLENTILVFINFH